MKSGKSIELIARAEPFSFANKRLRYIQPSQNVRDTGIASRSGLTVEAQKFSSLDDIPNDFDVIAIDEVNMFAAKDIVAVHGWLASGKVVIMAGIDLDYRAKMPPIIEKIYELNPDELIRKKAVCDICHVYNARFSQILDDGSPLLEGFDSLVPEDGRFEYQARCRRCFVRK